MQTVGVDPATIETAVHPPGNWILLRLDPPQTASEGGILIDQKAIPPSRTGVVVRQGPGRLSEDGKMLLPMNCKVGDRILFERAAGKGLPRCPRETTETRWAYLLLREGSVNAIIEPEQPSPAEQRGLDSGAAGVPPRPAGAEVPVSRLRGRLTASRLRPVIDWLAISLDARAEVLDPAPRGRVLAPVKKRYAANGRAVCVVEHEPEERADTWSGSVLARGPGLLTVVRCLDGDRMTVAPRLCEVGDRVLAAWTPPWVQILDPFKPQVHPGDELLIREYPCVCAVLAG